MNDNDKVDTTFLLGRIVADIKNINHKLDEIRDDIKEDLRNHESRLNGVETRITNMESWKKSAIAIAIAFSIAITAIWAIADDYVKDRLYGSHVEQQVKSSR